MSNCSSCYRRYTRNTRTRNLTWFSSAFSMIVATNIGNNFFLLVNECFPKNRKLHMIINKNTMKLSYSCMNNHHHHPVPCFIALAIMSFHIPRSLVAFRISTTLPAPSHLTSPSVIFSRCFPLLRFPSIIPVVMRCSNFSLLIT